MGKMIKKDCLYYEKRNDIGAIIHWCQNYPHLNFDCEKCERYIEEKFVRVVRCKNCEYAKHWYGDKARCFLWSENGIDVFEDGYCNYGKRRVDAEPVRHGRWLDVLVADDESETDGVECSECGYTDINVYWAKTYHKYCPNCGAKMDEVKEDA